MKAYIEAPQDPSVGMQSINLTLDLGDWSIRLPDGNADADELERVRAILQSAFVELCDDSGVRVWFDHERQDEPGCEDMPENKESLAEWRADELFADGCFADDVAEDWLRNRNEQMCRAKARF